MHDHTSLHIYSGQKSCLQPFAFVQLSSVFPLTFWRPVFRRHSVLQHVSHIFLPHCGLLHAAENDFILGFYRLMCWEVELQVPHYGLGFKP